LSLFPFSEYWWLYGSFFALVLGLLALDLGVFHKESKEVSFKESLLWTCVWVSLALLFNFGLYHFSLWKFSADPRLLAEVGFDAATAAKQVSLEFLTGFVVEKSLAFDNLFIFAVVFSYFAIPLKYQHRVLFYGILGALIFRAIFIALGSILMQYHVVIYIFGGFLILTGIRMLWSNSEKELEPQNNFIVRGLSKIVPLSKEFNGDRFLIKKDGRWMATPLLVALVFLEFTDIVFAVDSVPAIFAISKEPFIVLTSNIFAILGLRSLYFMLAGVMDRFEYLKYGLAAVLIFVGLKMAWLNDVFGGKFPIVWSLGIIFGLIGGSMVISWLLTKHKAKSTPAPLV